MRALELTDQHSRCKSGICDISEYPQAMKLQGFTSQFNAAAEVSKGGGRHSAGTGLDRAEYTPE
jgi:hypothetical protein